MGTGLRGSGAPGLGARGCALSIDLNDVSFGGVELKPWNIRSSSRSQETLSIQILFGRCLKKIHA